MRNLPLFLRRILLQPKWMIVTSVSAALLVVGGGYLTLKSHQPHPHAPNSGQSIGTQIATPGSTFAPNTPQNANPAQSSSSSKATSSPTPAPSKSQSSTPTLTSAQNTSSQSTAPPAPRTYSCVKTDNSNCDFAAVPYIVGSNSTPWVGQNIWNGSNGYQQTLYANSPKDWYVTANANTNFGGMLSYPNTGFFMPDGSNNGDHNGHVDSYSAITSSWNVTILTNPQTAGWAAYRPMV